MVNNKILPERAFTIVASIPPIKSLRSSK